LQWEKNDKIATLCKNIEKYKDWLSRQMDVSQTRSLETSDDTAKLEKALTAEEVPSEKVKDILEKCKGYEADILDFFFPETMISDPAPCTSDSAIMFASAPGKMHDLKNTFISLWDFFYHLLSSVHLPVNILFLTILTKLIVFFEQRGIQLFSSKGKQLSADTYDPCKHFVMTPCVI
jgi:hypothetical protein